MREALEWWNLETTKLKEKQSHEEKQKLVLPDYIIRHLKGTQVTPTFVSSFDDAPDSKSAVAYQVDWKDPDSVYIVVVYNFNTPSSFRLLLSPDWVTAICSP